MTALPPSSGLGASRLFFKFLFVLAPAFVVSSMIGLWLIAEHMAHEAENQLSARVGTQSAHIAVALNRGFRSGDSAAAQDLLSTLLHDPAILCAEVRSGSGGAAALNAPRGLGCVGQEHAEHFTVPVDVDGGKVLHVRFISSEVEATRSSYGEFSLLALLLGLLVSAGASYVGFRLIIGRPLKALLHAVRQTDTVDGPVYVPSSGTDELGVVIRAYNQMQENLFEESRSLRQRTAELRAERRLNEDLLSKVFQVSPYPFAIANPEDGTYHNVNEAWLSTMGYTRDEVIGRTAHELGIWVCSRERTRFVEQVKTEGSAHAHEAKVRTKDGSELDVLMSGEHVRLGGETRIFLVADDVTELKKAEAERQRHHAEILNAKVELEDTNRQLVQRTDELETTQDALVQQERLATLGELTATVSHELRNPLAAIRSSVHLVVQKTKDLDAGLDRPLERVERNIVRCDSIISDLLGYASNPDCETMHVEGDDWLSATLDELDVPPDVKLLTRFTAPKAQLLIAPERIRQVIVIIVENALQALSDMPEDRARMLTVSTAAEAENYTTVFEDTGPGMDAETVVKVFEPLFSTKSYGCGLGLATAKKIIEGYDGDIRFDSEPGAGTKVTVTLPMTDAHERAA